MSGGQLRQRSHSRIKALLADGGMLFERKRKRSRVESRHEYIARLYGRIGHYIIGTLTHLDPESRLLHGLTQLHRVIGTQCRRRGHGVIRRLHNHTEYLPALAPHHTLHRTGQRRAQFYLRVVLIMHKRLALRHGIALAHIKPGQKTLEVAGTHSHGGGTDRLDRSVGRHSTLNPEIESSFEFQCISHCFTLSPLRSIGYAAKLPKKFRIINKLLPKRIQYIHSTIYMAQNMKINRFFFA